MFHMRRHHESQSGTAQQKIRSTLVAHHLVIPFWLTFVLLLLAASITPYRAHSFLMPLVAAPRRKPRRKVPLGGGGSIMTTHSWRHHAQSPVGNNDNLDGEVTPPNTESSSSVVETEEPPTGPPPPPTTKTATSRANTNATPSPQHIMTAMGTSPRRILLSFASASAIALAANFLGLTSKLLEAVPESTVEATGLDSYFPRGPYNRFKGQGYTFVIPKEWVADTAVELAKVQRRTGSLDYRMSRADQGGGVLPDAAFGPPGRLDSRGVSKGDTNVSVVISKVKPGFSLQSNLGTPTNAAETFLRLSLAPEGSGRVATLVCAEEDMSRQVYQFEYDVDRGERGPPLRAISLIAVRDGNTLLTLTVVAPRQEWESLSEESKLRKVAESFHLT